MKNRIKKERSETKQATIPAWECPRCGRTHPITVGTCECGPCVFRPAQPYPQYQYPFHPWGRPDITCITEARSRS